MGFDLTILPLRNLRELTGQMTLCYNRLAFDRDYRIFGQISKMDYEDIPEKPILNPRPIPAQLFAWLYEDEGIDRTREDKYGEELTFLYAEEMKRLNIPENASPMNKAIKAFIDTLPNDTPIILQWR